MVALVQSKTEQELMAMPQQAPRRQGHISLQTPAQATRQRRGSHRVESTATAKNLSLEQHGLQQARQDSHGGDAETLVAAQGAGVG